MPESHDMTFSGKSSFGIGLREHQRHQQTGTLKHERLRHLVHPVKQGFYILGNHIENPEVFLAFG